MATLMAEGMPEDEIRLAGLMDNVGMEGSTNMKCMMKKICFLDQKLIMA